MNLSIFQIIGLLAVLIIVSRTVLLSINGVKTIREVLAMILLGIILGILLLNEGFFAGIAKLLGFQVGANAFFTFSILILFYFMFKQQLKNDLLENSITRVVRKLALDEIRKK